VRQLDVSVEGDAVVLRGQSSTQYIKQLAQHFAAKLTGMPVRANEIQVVPEGAP
jgi:hypothetical protein